MELSVGAEVAGFFSGAIEIFIILANMAHPIENWPVHLKSDTISIRPT